MKIGVIALVSDKILRVTRILVSPWRYSNEQLLEEVRMAARDASASKTAVSRLRSELRGEVEASPDVEAYRAVMPGREPRKIPQPQAGAQPRKGQSMAKIINGER